MAGFIPAIHVFTSVKQKDVDARDKPGHDGVGGVANQTLMVWHE
jgi:hypothetical protein